ncbi:MAG: peptide chain release factor N(5)-glutamine methyltransferase [Desulfobacteraceae bacterium]
MKSDKKTWIIKDLLPVSIDFLKEKNIESARLCAEILLARQLNTDRLKLYLEYDQPVGEKDLDQYRAMIKRLIDGEPLQYITGIQEFWSMDFIVNSSVLIPRPETEILIEQAIKVYNEYFREYTGNISILDIGTGSGAIALAIASEIENAEITAVDISQPALETAKKNAEKHELTDRVRFTYGDLFEPFKETQQNFDIILSNPPYVTTGEYESLPVKIKNFEPKTALVGDEDGLCYIRTIITEAHAFLCPGGWLMLEMAPDQIEKSAGMIRESSKYTDKHIIKDYNNKDRVLVARNKIY